MHKKETTTCSTEVRSMQHPHAIDPSAVATAQRQALSPSSEREMRRLLDVLCDATRLKIVRALRGNQLAASDLARVLGRSRSATSQHLRVLREAGVVQASRLGNIVRYQLADDLNAEILTEIGTAFDRLERQREGASLPAT
jgi:DNA-binding transcriptional ArsR family regulator